MINNNHLVVTIPAHRNSFFIASILNILLPVFDDCDEDDLEQEKTIVESLFGKTFNIFELKQLALELKKCHVALFPHLNHMINTYLRPELSNYVLNHKDDFIRLGYSDFEVIQQATYIEKGLSACGEMEIFVFACFVKAKVNVYASFDSDSYQTYMPSADEPKFNLNLSYAWIGYTDNSEDNGYLRHNVLGNGDCGFTAFGISREHAFTLLNENIGKIKKLIQPLVEEALLLQSFFQYLQGKEIINAGLSFDEFSNNTENYLNEKRVCSAFLEYDIIEHSIDHGWAHPLILHALARVLNLNMRLWKSNANQQLLSANNYVSYISNERSPWIHLLYNGKDHFDRLEIIGCDSSDFNSPLLPIAQSLGLMCQVQISCKLSTKLVAQLQSLSKLNNQAMTISLVSKNESVLVNEIDPFLKVIKRLLKEVSPHLNNVSSHLPKKPEFNDPLALTLVEPHKASELSSRFNSIGEIGTFDAVMSSVILNKDEEHKIDDNWAYASATWEAGKTGAAVGALGGIVVHLVEGYIIGASAAVAAIPTIGLPLAGISMLISAGVGYVGKGYAAEYEKALLEANTEIKNGKFENAKVILENQFNGWIAPFFRSFVLTKEHYCLAHFFRGLCAEQATDFLRAYKEYRKAHADAQASAKLPAIFLTALFQINLLKKYPMILNEELKSYKTNPEDEMNRLLRELTNNDKFKHAFSDLYWRLFGKIAATTSLFKDYLSGNNKFTEELIQSIGHFLVFDDFYILKYYVEGSGQYMEVFSAFFQSIILTASYLTKVKVLPDQTMKPLHESDVLSRFEQCHGKLKQFQINHIEFIRNNEAVEDGIMLIEKTILDFYYYWYHHVIKNTTQYEAKTSTLDLAYLDLSSRTIFLEKLKEEFSLNYASIEIWLEDIINDQKMSKQISSLTGNTLLHMLVALKQRDTKLKLPVQLAAKKLSSLAGIRNKNNASPCNLLEKNDPFSLKEILYTEELLDIYGTLDQLEKFLQRVQTTPNITNHLILLEGSPGTGKSETVTNYLKNKDYIIDTWIKGDEKDMLSNQEVVRCIDFFKKAKGNIHKSRDRVLVLFIDEIDGFLPKNTGKPVDPGYKDPNEIITEVQTQLSLLKGQRIVCIGTTNYPERLPKPIIDRIGLRLNFPLPDETQRLILLHHFLRKKCISSQSIEKLAKVAVGYSPRQLQAFVDSIVEDTISFDVMAEYFNKYIEAVCADFHKDFPSAKLFMPSFVEQEKLEDLFPENRKLASQMARIQEDVTADPKKHTLFHGPSGTGKTRAASIFSKYSGRVMISIDAYSEMSSEDLRLLLNRIMQYGRAILFIDEIDRIASVGHPCSSILQTRMAGISNNFMTVIGATNKKDEIEPAVQNRFTVNIELAALPLNITNQVISNIILHCVTTYNTPVYFDVDLMKQMQDDAIILAENSLPLSIRPIKTAIQYLFGDLQRANKEIGFPAVTYLRLADILFSLYIAKIDANIPISNNSAESVCLKDYIIKYRDSFFKAIQPSEGTLAPIKQLPKVYQLGDFS